MPLPARVQLSIPGPCFSIISEGQIWRVERPCRLGHRYVALFSSASSASAELRVCQGRCKAWLESGLLTSGLALQAASKTNDTAGDGTTTATILSAAIIAEGMKIVAAGTNPIQVSRASSS